MNFINNLATQKKNYCVVIIFLNIGTLSLTEVVVWPEMFSMNSIKLFLYSKTMLLRLCSTLMVFTAVTAFEWNNVLAILSAFVVILISI